MTADRLCVRCREPLRSALGDVCFDCQVSPALPRDVKPAPRRQPTHGRCERCATPFAVTHAGGQPKRFCSKRCCEAARYEANPRPVKPDRRFACRHCGAACSSVHPHAAYCGGTCAKGAQRARELADAAPRPPCERCGQDMTGRRGNARFCSELCYTRAYRGTGSPPGPCPVCGVVNPERTRRATYCSGRCARRGRRLGMTAPAG
ncbi:MAG: hypothetical protein ACRC33_30705 [Gemmataceae bacterium]